MTTAPSRKRSWQPLVWYLNYLITQLSRGARRYKTKRPNRLAAQPEVIASHPDECPTFPDRRRHASARLYQNWHYSPTVRRPPSSVRLEKRLSAASMANSV